MLDFGPFTNVITGAVVIVPDLDALRSQLVPPMLKILHENTLEILIGTGAGARTYPMSLPKFTMIATCVNLWRVHDDLLQWLTVEEFAPYKGDVLCSIVKQQAEAMGLSIDYAAAQLLASVSNGRPGGTHTILQRMAKLGLGGELSAAEILQAATMLGLPVSSDSQAGLLQHLRSMSGVEFEQWVAALFRDLGYSATLTKIVGDHGIDLFLQRGTDRVAVQCKRWNDNIGESIVRDFLGSLHNAGVTNGMIITTSTFSTQARIFAERNGIKLLDIGALTQFAVHGEDGLGSLKPIRRILPLS
jgi:hypothetical protein